MSSSWPRLRHAGPRSWRSTRRCPLPHSVTCEQPGCVRCSPDQTTYLGRDVDALAGGMPTVMISGIAYRGIYLARRLRARGYEVIEVSRRT